MMLRFIPLIVTVLVSLSGYAQVPPDGPGRWKFPQTRTADGYSILMYAPQIRSWPDFEHYAAVAAIEVTYPDGKHTDIGAIAIEGSTTIDLEKRLVLSSAPKIPAMHFKTTLSQQTQAAIRAVFSKKPIEIPLDLFLAHVADSVLDSTAPKGFNFDPPDMYVVSVPTILLHLGGGKPVLESIEHSSLQRVVNANWPVFKDSGNAPYYLLAEKTWLTAGDLQGTWQTTQTIPAAFSALLKDKRFEAIRAAIPPAKDKGPDVIYTAVPAELVVIEGDPKLADIPGTGGLQYVSNTESPLFKLGESWYFLAAGRWFATEHNVYLGPWTWQQHLPEAFSKIPADSPVAHVRASVAGTVEAKMAALEAMLPVHKKVAANSAAPVEVSYAGEPVFEPIPDTSLARAANTEYDVVRYQDTYYLCYAGAWYTGTAATGPFVATYEVPDAIYTIPPSSPVYPVTQVTVADSSTTEIIYTYPYAYTSGIYVVYGVPYYGTGWYYAPWIYGAYYYPYYGSYGHGSWYNPYTGRYGSRSVYYGPYGGNAYTSGYNPRTGRYGEVYTSWNGEDWGSYGQTYNPRTGVGTTTSRYYDGDDNKMTMNRTTQRGDQSVVTSRTTDFDNQTSHTERTTSAGGSSEVNRSWGDGSVNTSREIQTADGRSASIESSRDASGGSTSISGSGGGSASVSREVGDSGVTREGSFSRDGNTLTTQTERSGRGSTTEFQTSGGASGKSVSDGFGNRVTVGSSGSGDVFAARDGQIYKKTGDGWEPYERPSGSGRSSGSADSLPGMDGARRSAASSQSVAGLSARDRADLDRDFGARQSAARSYEGRGMGGGFDRGGFDRGSFGGGGFNRGGFGGGGFGRGGGGFGRRR